MKRKPRHGAGAYVCMPAYGRDVDYGRSSHTVIAGSAPCSPSVSGVDNHMSSASVGNASSALNGLVANPVNVPLRYEEAAPQLAIVISTS